MAKDFRDKERLDPLPAEHFFEKHKGRKRGRKEGRKRKIVLFNDALNSFIYGYIALDIMVNNRSDKEIGNSLPPRHGLLFPNNSKGSFT